MSLILENVSHSGTHGYVKILQNVALYFYAFTLNIEFFHLLGLEWSLAKFAGIFYLLVVLLSFNLFFSVSKKSLYFLWPALAMFFCITLNDLFRLNDLSFSFFDLTLFLNIAIVLIIINHGRRGKHVLDNAMLAFAIGSGILSLLMFLDIGTSVNAEGRTTVLGANRNELGMKASLALVILLFFIQGNYFRYRAMSFLLLGFVPLLLVAIIDTGSRSALLVLVISLCIWTFFNGGKNTMERFVGYFLVGVIVVASIVLVVRSEVMMERIFAVTETGLTDGYGERVKVWTNYSSLAQENLFIGLGKTGFQNEAMERYGAVMGAHNVFLEVLLYSGLVGLLFYLIFIFRVFSSAYTVYRRAGDELPLLLLSGMMVMLGANQALHVKIFWLLAAYVISSSIHYYRIYRLEMFSHLHLRS